MIIPSLKLIIVHIPKTGGTHISDMIKKLNIKYIDSYTHSTISHIKYMIFNR